MNGRDTLSREQLGALRDILTWLAGTPTELTGDIAITFEGVRYVISSHTGAYAAAMVTREGVGEVVGSTAPYRRELVQQVAGRALALAHDVGVGSEFTVRGLIADDWRDLSDVEQRNVGKRFRRLLEPGPLGQLDEWQTSDNEWHYRRR